MAPLNAVACTANPHKLAEFQALFPDWKLDLNDEVIGQWVALAGAASLNWKTYLGAFTLFRLFDIWKPAPVRQLEALPGGMGIVADDVMAGVYGNLLMWGLVLLLPSWLT